MEMHATALDLWQRKAFDDAESALLKSFGAAIGIWTLFDLAELFTQRAKWELAEEYWEKFYARRGTVLLRGWFPGALVLAAFYRASAAQARKDRVNAFRYAQEVLDYWSGNPRL